MAIVADPAPGACPATTIYGRLSGNQDFSAASSCVVDLWLGASTNISQ